MDAVNSRIINQVVGSSGSIGANYREANDSLGKKFFLQKLRISRREAKEAFHWLEVLGSANEIKSGEIMLLIRESVELKNILSTMMKNGEIKK